MGQRILLGVLVLLLVTTGLALAKGWPAKAVITGPGLPGKIEITDPALVDLLSYSFDAQEAVPKPEVAEPGYEITIHLSSERGGGEIVEFMHQRYYPDPYSGRGYIFYGEGEIIIDGRDVGDWFYAQEEWEAAMQEIIAKYSEQSPTLPPLATAAVMAIGLAMLGLAWRLRMRGRPSPTT